MFHGEVEGDSKDVARASLGAVGLLWRLILLVTRGTARKSTPILLKVIWIGNGLDICQDQIISCPDLRLMKYKSSCRWTSRASQFRMASTLAPTFSPLPKIYRRQHRNFQDRATSAATSWSNGGEFFFV